MTPEIAALGPLEDGGDGSGAIAWFLIIASPFVGSFLGVVVHRLPGRQSVLFGRSHCDRCFAPIALLDLIPIFGWLRLMGRCRSCRAPITPLYPALECAALALALWAWIAVPPSLMLASCLLGWTLLTLAVIDARTGLLPDSLTLPLLAAGLVTAAAVGGAGFTAHLVGAAAGGGAMVAVGWAYRHMRKREGLGLGDAKLFAAAGAWLGWAALPSALLIGAVGALAVTLARLPRSEWRGDREIAFGVYLALGTWFVWLYGPLEMIA